MKKPLIQINFSRLLEDKRLVNDHTVYTSLKEAEKQLAFFIFSKDIFNIKVKKLP